MRPLLVVFEGCDKSGKSTLYKAFRERTSWGPLALERFTGSNIVYDSIYNREGRDDSDMFALEYDLLSIFDIRIVYCRAEEEVIRRRIEREEVLEQRDRALSNFKEVKTQYETYYLNKTAIPYIIIDTTNIKVEDCVKQILDFIRWGRA